MEKEVEERFERIEHNLERVTERMDQISEAHLELEAAQKNTTIALNAVSYHRANMTESMTRRIHTRLYFYRLFLNRRYSMDGSCAITYLHRLACQNARLLYAGIRKYRVTLR